MSAFHMPTPTFTPAWSEPLEAPVHSCGNCKTSYGISAIPCRNDTERIERERRERVAYWKQRFEQLKGTGHDEI